MRITVIQRGALKDRQLAPLIDEYAKRFSRFGKLTIKESKRPEWPSGHYRVLCDEHGTQPTSVVLAHKLEQWSIHHGAICFAIGDADGHDADFAEAAHERFALSALTFPHRIAHLLLIEQIYRAGCILAGHPYHHA